MVNLYSGLLVLFGRLDGSALRVTAALDVGLDVEVQKEQKQGGHVEQHSVVHPAREGAVNHQTPQTVATVDKELSHLHLGNVALPWHLDAIGGEQVVAVHPEVNERVLDRAKIGCIVTTKRIPLGSSRMLKQQETHEHTRATSNPLDTDPPEREHAYVMVQVQEGNLIILFAKHHQNLKTGG